MNINDDQIYEIVKWITDIRDIIHLTVVSERFNKLMQSNYLWQYYYRIANYQIISNNLSYKSQYEKCYKILKFIRYFSLIDIPIIQIGCHRQIFNDSQLNL